MCVYVSMYVCVCVHVCVCMCPCMCVYVSTPGMSGISMLDTFAIIDDAIPPVCLYKENTIIIIEYKFYIMRTQCLTHLPSSITRYPLCVCVCVCVCVCIDIAKAL